MELHTKYHGVVKIEEEEIIQFVHGLPGFLEEKDFILLPLDENSPYFIMQSVMSPELGFVVTEPFWFLKNYEFELTSYEKEALKISQDSQIKVLTILSLKDPFTDTTVNLQAPIIINNSKTLAKQIILDVANYSTRHRLFKVASKK